MRKMKTKTATHTVDLVIHAAAGSPRVKGVPCRLLTNQIVVVRGGGDTWRFSTNTGRPLRSFAMSCGLQGVAADPTSLAPIEQGASAGGAS